MFRVGLRGCGFSLMIVVLPLKLRHNIPAEHASSECLKS